MLIKSLKDQKILSNIIEDARIPVSELAKKTKLSREIVQYRLRNLEKDLIAGYQARVNLKIFYNSMYTLFLNIQGLERKEIIVSLKKLSSVHWIGSSLGKWNYIITFSVNDPSELNEFFNNFSNLFKQNSIKYLLVQQIKEYKDSFSGLFGENKILTSQNSNSKIKLDGLDKKIIESLTKNARMSNEEIAKKVNLTREGVRLRIKNLEKNKIILNYRTLIKPQELDLTSYFISIKCKNYNSNNVDKLCHFLSNLRSFSYVCITSGDYNIIGDFTELSMKDVDKLIQKIQCGFSEVIDEIELFPLVEVNGQNYLPD